MVNEKGLVPCLAQDVLTWWELMLFFSWKGKGWDTQKAVCSEKNLG